MTHDHTHRHADRRGRLQPARRSDQIGAKPDVDDIVILERSDRVGGTWRDTTLPGCQL